MKQQLTTLLFLFFISSLFSQNILIDETNVLSMGQRDQIMTRLKSLKSKYGVDVRCIIPSSLNGKNPDKYTLEKGDALKVGTIGINNGIILMIAPKEEQFFIAVSYGVQWQVTDKEVNAMVDAVLGKFKGKHYANGILVCLDQIEKELTSTNFNVVEAKLNATDFSKMVGKVVAFDYNGTGSKANFRMPAANDLQFDPGFKIELRSDGKKKADLYYDKNMGGIISELVSSKKTLVFARVRKAVPLELELLGTMKF
jgi:hypothetical protein